MERAVTSREERRTSPMGWHMVPGGQQISDHEFLHVLDKGGFDQLPHLISWKQYQTVLQLFFPWKAKIALCMRCEGATREASGKECARCKGSGVEQQTSVA